MKLPNYFSAKVRTRPSPSAFMARGGHGQDAANIQGCCPTIMGPGVGWGWHWVKGSQRESAQETPALAPCVLQGYGAHGFLRSGVQLLLLVLGQLEERGNALPCLLCGCLQHSSPDPERSWAARPTQPYAEVPTCPGHMLSPGCPAGDVITSPSCSTQSPGWPPC